MVEFKFSVDHGKNKKGSKVTMHKSTAEALEAHKIGEIGKPVKVVKKDEE